MIEMLFPFAALLFLLLISLADRWINDKGKYWYVIAMYCCLSVAAYSFFQLGFSTEIILLVNGALLGILLRQCIVFAISLYDSWQMQQMEIEQLQVQYDALVTQRNWR